MSKSFEPCCVCCSESACAEPELCALRHQLGVRSSLRGETDPAEVMAQGSMPDTCTRCGAKLNGSYKPIGDGPICVDQDACKSRQATNQWVWTSCLQCGSQFRGTVGKPRFCNDDHEAAWWHDRKQLATIQRREY